MERTEFSKEATKLDSEFQYLDATKTQVQSVCCKPRRGCGGASPHFRIIRPGYFEDSQQAYTTQHGDAERRHDLGFHQDGLQNPAADHKAVEAVEERDEVRLWWGVGGWGNPISMTFFSVSIQFTRPVLYLKAQAVHLQEHLTGEECEQHLVGYV